MCENTARACWQGRYQNCDVWYCAPSVFSAGAAGASCSGWQMDCKPEHRNNTKPASAGLIIKLSPANTRGNKYRLTTCA
ncbi:hypothetical protein FQG83_26210 [Escherichia coli]|nr:hypothetical protein [Escherichia coli]